MKKWPKRLPNFEVFNENEFLETSNDLDDGEISLFIVENRNVKTTKKKKLTSSPLEKQRPLKKFPPRNLTIFYVICLLKSRDGTHLFSGAVFNKCTIVVGQKSPAQSHPKRRVVIVTFESCLFCRVLSFRSFTR